MTINQLASKIAKLEGKRSQARIGDLREILGILSDILCVQDIDEPGNAISMLCKNGEKRAKRKKKK